MSLAPYYIIIARKNQVMLSFLPLRVVVNGKDIYALADDQPVLIPVEKDNPEIVITDGFHFTKPLKLTYKKPGYFNFHVVCAIEDYQLLCGGVILGVLYLLGFITDFFILKLLSFSPIICLLIYYYLNRRSFLRIVKSKK